MRIRGFLNNEYEPPAPFVKVLLVSKSLNIRKFLNLCIDTGASSTIILDRDVRYLGLKSKDLKRTGRSVGGIGGLIDTYLIEDATMLFKTEEGMLLEEKLALLVGVHEFNRLAEKERVIIIRLPSLLGRDILRKFKFTFDEKEDLVLLEK